MSSKPMVQIMAIRHLHTRGETKMGYEITIHNPHIPFKRITITNRQIHDITFTYGFKTTQEWLESLTEQHLIISNQTKVKTC